MNTLKMMIEHRVHSSRKLVLVRSHNAGMYCSGQP